MPIGTALGALGALGSIGSAVGALTAAGGQNTAAGVNLAAGLNAQNAAAFTNAGNSSAESPYTQLGSASAGTLGSLLGYGTLTGNASGQGASFSPDPNAQANALAQINALARGSGAVQPTLSNATFTPESKSSAISQTFAADPSYAWRLSQGLGALNSAGAAAGMGRSGAQLQALNDYAGNSASQEYGNWYGRLNQQNQYNLGVDQYNTNGGLATNAQNFGQQQQRFSNTQGQFNNAMGYLTGGVNSGVTATDALGNATAGLTANSNNAGVNSSGAAANNFANAGNALSAGITGGINSLASGYAYQNGMNGGNGGYSYGGIGPGATNGVTPGYGAGAWNAALANSTPTVGASPY